MDKNRWIYKVVTIIFIGLFWLMSTGLGAASQKEIGKVVLIIMDRITLSDLANNDLPNLHKLINQGAIGLMNTNVAPSAERNSDSTYATIGAGSRIDGRTLGLAFNVEEKYQGSLIEDIFFRRTGIKANEKNIVNIGIAQSINANSELNYIAIPGLLGQTLKENGYQSAVIGNSDSNIEPYFHRQVATIAMDTKGVVNQGIVDERIYQLSPQSPMGIKTNYPALLKYFKEFKIENQFIVIDLGDTSRVDEGANYTLKERVEAQRKEALSAGDQFIGDLLQEMDLSKDLLVFVSPTPSAAALLEKDSLTPVIIAGKDVTSGVLTSATTKRLGIVYNIDLSASIINHFAIDDPSEIVGRNITSLPMVNPMDYLADLKGRTVLTANIRNGFISGFVIISTILFLLGAFLVYKQRHWGGKLRPLLVFLLSIPISFYLMPLFPQPDVYMSLLEVAILTISLTFIAWQLGRKNILDPFLIISLVTILTITIDLFTGTSLGFSCLLSYDPMVGARFYGIGNEYMGVLIGATILFSTGLIQRYNLNKKHFPLIFFLFIFITYIIAAPNLGTNVGGTIAAAAGFISTAILLLNIKINKKVVLCVLGGISLVVMTFIIFDLSRSSAYQTHIGRTINLILDNGPSVAIDIIVRKLGVNIKLISYSHWSRDYFIPLGILIWLLYRPAKVAEEIHRQYPIARKGCIGVLIASIFALIFNDSGIVAAATMIIFGAVPLLSLVLAQNIGKELK